jgi:hypothetical protein
MNKVNIMHQIYKVSIPLLKHLCIENLSTVEENHRIIHVYWVNIPLLQLLKHTHLCRSRDSLSWLTISSWRSCRNDAISISPLPVWNSCCSARPFRANWCCGREQAMQMWGAFEKAPTSLLCPQRTQQRWFARSRQAGHSVCVASRADRPWCSPHLVHSPEIRIELTF